MQSDGHTSLWGLAMARSTFAHALAGESLSPLANPRGQGRLSRFKSVFPAPLPPQADTYYVQPQYIGDPRPYDSALRWTRGSRQPSDPAGGAVFNRQHTDSASSGVQPPPPPPPPPR